MDRARPAAPPRAPRAPPTAAALLSALAAAARGARVEKEAMSQLAHTLAGCETAAAELELAARGGGAAGAAAAALAAALSDGVALAQRLASLGPFSAAWRARTTRQAFLDLRSSAVAALSAAQAAAATQPAAAAFGSARDALALMRFDQRPQLVRRRCPGCARGVVSLQRPSDLPASPGLAGLAAPSPPSPHA